MWIFTTSGFLSIVQHKDADGHFQIKSRVRAPLEELWPDHEIMEIGWADYRYRINIRKDDAIPVLVEEIGKVHPNFLKSLGFKETRSATIETSCGQQQVIAPTV